MKFPSTTSSALLTLLTTLLSSSYIFQHAAASPSPQGINFNKPPTNDVESSSPEMKPVKLTVFPAGKTRQTLSFSLTRGLAIETLGMVTDVVAARLDDAPENTRCLFWRLNDENQSFLDRTHFLMVGVMSMVQVERAFAVFCYDETRPEFLIGYRDS